MNELLRSKYFEGNESALRDIDVESVSRIFPSSAHSPEKNVNTTSTLLIEKFIEGKKKPLIVIGHSKGGLEVLLSILTYPELIERGVVEQIVLAQSPVRGSHMGDQINANFKLLPRVMFLDGARSLQTEEIDNAIRQKIIELRRANPKLLAEISKRVVYVTSQKNIKEVDPVYSPSARYLKYKFRKMNDGLVATEEMWIPGFGIVLGRLNADHTELFVSPTKVLRSGSENKSSSFIYALIKNLDHGKKIKHARPKPITKPKTSSFVEFCINSLLHLLH